MNRDEIRERLLAELPDELDTADELTGGFLEARVDRLELLAGRVVEQAALPILASSSGWYLSRIGEALGVPRRVGELDDWLRERIRLALFTPGQGTVTALRDALEGLLVAAPEIVEWVRDTVFLGVGRSFLGGPRNWLRDPDTDEGGAFRFLVRLKSAERAVKPYAVFLSASRFLGAHYLFDVRRVTYSGPLWVAWWLVNRLRAAGTAFDMEVV